MQDIQNTSPTVTSSFSFSEITYAQTLAAFKKAGLTSEGDSPDGIKLKHLSDFLPLISTFFTKLYNVLLQTATYPQIWKRTLIVPLLKKPNATSVGDTRPITNICHFAKPFDSIISTQISHYFESNNLFSPYQSGFRAGYSTHTTLLKLIDDIRAAIDRGEITLLLYDISKAFNSVNHEHLLQILKFFGFHNNALSFLFNYLWERQIFTNGSTDVDCTCGVGQGSKPGRILFTVLINTLVQAFLFSWLLLFVDAQAYIHGPVSNISEIVQKMNVDSAELVAWADRVGFNLNAGKHKR